MTREDIATEAARQIRDALNEVNRDKGFVMVLWPSHITLLDNGVEYVYEFTEALHRPQVMD